MLFVFNIFFGALIILPYYIITILDIGFNTCDYILQYIILVDCTIILLNIIIFIMMIILQMIMHHSSDLEQDDISYVTTLINTLSIVIFILNNFFMILVFYTFIVYNLLYNTSRIIRIILFHAIYIIFTDLIYYYILK